MNIFSIIWGMYTIKVWLYSYCCNPLSCVVLTGKRVFTTNNDIRNAIMQSGVLGTFLTQDINVIQKKIEQLSWIKQVSVRKKWPDILQIHLIEYIPIAYWNNNSMISTTGIIFKVPVAQFMKKNDDQDFAWMSVLYGPNSKAADVLNSYLIFNKIFTPNALRIKSVKMDIRSSWELVITGNIYLKLGRKNIIKKLLYFVTIYPILIQKIHEHNKYVDYVDLRYNSGCAVKWMNNIIMPATFVINRSYQ